MLRVSKKIQKHYYKRFVYEKNSLTTRIILSLSYLLLDNKK